MNTLAQSVPVDMTPLRTRAKKSEANYIIVKCRSQNLVGLVDDAFGIMKNPDKASERALRKLQATFGISYSQPLFSIASYEYGHYLIYDNDRVLAYTVIRV